MAFSSIHGVRIKALAAAVPDNQIQVEEFVPTFGEEVVSRFVKSTGIQSIYRALPEQTAGDLAYAAAEQLLESLAIDRASIGFLIFVTQSPDYRRPATACVLQKRLGLSMDCAVFDVGLGCSGFIYGVQTAMTLMASGDAPYGLVLLGETASKLANPQDRSIAMMYGDAGAAVLLERAEDAHTTALLQSDGQRFTSIIAPAGGFRDMNPDAASFVCQDGIERTLYDIRMEGTEVFTFSITDVPRALERYLEHTKTTVADYDVFAFHQANQFILRQLTRKLKLPREAVPLSLDRYGNTGGISIPLTLCDSYGQDHASVVKVLACGFGIGLSWGIANYEIVTDGILPITYTSEAYVEGRLKPGEY